MTEFLASVNSGVCRKFRGDSLSLLNNLLCSVLNNLTVNIWLWQPQEALISFISECHSQTVALRIVRFCPYSTRMKVEVD